MNILEMINEYVRKFDRYLVSSVGNITKSRYWQSSVKFIKTYPTYFILSLLVLYFAFRDSDSDSDSGEAKNASLERRIWETDVQVELKDVNDQLEVLTESLDDFTNQQENRDRNLLQSLKDEHEQTRQVFKSSTQSVIQEIASAAVNDSSENPKNWTIKMVNIREAADYYLENEEESFKNRYKEHEASFYVVEGELELNHFSGYKMYGLKQKDNALLLSSANALDYWFPTLRKNVGKKVILGTSELKFAIVLDGSDRNRLTSRGYSAKGNRVMCAADLIVKGVPPISKANGEQDMEEHAKKLNVLYSAFVNSIVSLDEPQ